MKRKILSVILCIFTFSIFTFTGCIHEEAHVTASREFSAFNDGKLDCAMAFSNKINFQDHTLRLNDSNYINGDVVVLNGKIYILSRNNELGVVDIHSYDANTRTKNIEYVINTTSYLPYSIGYGNKIYMEYLTNQDDIDSRTVVSYDVVTREFEELGSGMECDLYNYVPVSNHCLYSYLYNGQVVNNESGATKKFNITDLKKVLSEDLIRKFEIRFYQVDFSNDRIFVSYKLEDVSRFTDSTDAYAVYEYDFENDLLEFKMLGYAYFNHAFSIYALS